MQRITHYMMDFFFLILDYNLSRVKIVLCTNACREGRESEYFVPRPREAVGTRQN